MRDRRYAGRVGLVAAKTKGWEMVDPTETFEPVAFFQLKVSNAGHWRWRVVKGGRVIEESKGEYISKQGALDAFRYRDWTTAE